MPNLSDEDKFIEKSGIFFENLGVSQMSGRIIGYLMISDNPLQSLTEITERLGVSKSSVSTAVKGLVNMTMVIKKGRPGSRMDYYELNSALFSSVVKAKSSAVIKFQKIVVEALELNNIENERRELLREMMFFYDFFLEEFPKIFVKWEAHKKKLIEKGELKAIQDISN